MGTTSSSSSGGGSSAQPMTTISGKPGGSGNVVANILPILTKDINTKMVLVAGKGGAVGQQGLPSQIKLHDGNVASAAGGASNVAAASNSTNSAINKLASGYGRGGQGNSAGSDGFASAKVFTLTISKK